MGSVTRLVHRASQVANSFNIINKSESQKATENSHVKVHEDARLDKLIQYSQGDTPTCIIQINHVT